MPSLVRNSGAYLLPASLLPLLRATAGGYELEKDLFFYGNAPGSKERGLLLLR